MSSNLIPMNKRTKEEQRRITTMGGKASGVSRRERKKIKEDLILMLSTVMSNGKTTQENWMTALAKNLLKGDVPTANFVRDTVGEKPADKVELSGDVASVANDIGEYVNSEAKDSN